MTDWDYRLLMLRVNVRVLWLNIWHGWTTSDQRYTVFTDGQCAVESSAHYPINQHQHPVLKEEFDAGAACARGHYADEEANGYLQEMEDTYAAIEQDEMKAVFHECRDLGLISASGKILHN